MDKSNEVLSADLGSAKGCFFEFTGGCFTSIQITFVAIAIDKSASKFISTGSELWLQHI
jgi:hypothetical protein